MEKLTEFVSDNLYVILAGVGIAGLAVFQIWYAIVKMGGFI